ncbi:hypothetical protein GLOTRDRAFT_58576 [Gloeophyllum trabeum ATCC 11539]|uniref:Uncharacterized protein n=1 Tax=Gloeophyllum trabeum (strain ATCC 11539 / FP-39264 / Madison 617) TaxID=670483 RepID=S7QD42_GLOTA|nr:uncharacterized protein GLOTRDRAFT_58576 [Gloeophyllum trabeum ATCC 11539]EPQ57308.1 hypothetical protein GLOTRDRAFT_58576 [Gloeophyllum trabeum ATCC 11539]
MSTGSYRLQTARARPTPPPLRFNNTSSKAIVAANDNSEPLLYDLPSAKSPPPTSGTFASNVSNATSPTSPTYTGRPRGGRGRRMTPPPSHARSTTPSRGVARSDVEEFGEYCRRWYYNQDEEAGRLMTQILSTLPHSQRAPFAKLQASIRSKYHAHMSARRAAEFQAHLSATHPGGSLMPHSRANPSGPLARKERYERFDRFVKTWCTVGMPGTKPFFEGLWAVMRLQVLPEDLGGAGPFRIEWELDDAVFKEAAGKDFMLEAIDVLKGVLAFEEVPSSRRSNSWNSFSPLSRSHSRSQSQPLPSSAPTDTQRLPVPSVGHVKRPRAPSDPFLDTPALSRSLASSASNSSCGTSGALLAAAPEQDPPSPASVPADTEDVPVPSYGDYALNEDDEEEYLRTWTSPDLPNPEYLSLLKVFPSFITRRTLPRFPVTTGKGRPLDLEEGEDEPRREVRCGTGIMWVSSKERCDGWKGSWWDRFVLWWRKIFC